MARTQAPLEFRKLEPFGFEVTLDSPDVSEAQSGELRRHYRQDGLLPSVSSVP